MAKRKVSTISAVVFNVQLDSGKCSHVDVLRQLLGRTKAIALTTKTKQRYQSGSFRKVTDQNIWAGRMDQLEDAQRSAWIQRGGNYEINDEENEASDGVVPTTRVSTNYVYNSTTQTIVYRERSGLPYTRFESYLRRAMLQCPPEMKGAVTFSIAPRLAFKTISEWVHYVTRLDKVAIQYRPAQSPGNNAVKKIFERLNAGKLSQSARARPNESLDPNNVLDTDLPIGQALDHIERNPRNGTVEIVGFVGDDHLVINTADPVARVRVDGVVDLPASIILALAEISIAPPPDEPPPEDDQPEPAAREPLKRREQRRR